MKKQGKTRKNRKNNENKNEKHLDKAQMQHKIREKSHRKLLKSKLNAKLFFRFHKLPLKITEISHFFEEKIEKVGVLF